MRQNLGAILQSSMQMCIRQLKYAILERVCHFVSYSIVGIMQNNFDFRFVCCAYGDVFTYILPQ